MPVTRTGVLKRTPSTNISSPSSSSHSNPLPPSSSSDIRSSFVPLRQKQSTSTRSKSKKPLMPVQLSQEVIEISSDEDDTPPPRRPVPQPSASGSDLRKEVRRLKDSNALFKSQVKSLQNELDAQKEKTRSLEIQRSGRSNEISLNYSELDDIISCSICTHTMLTPFLLPACGHTFCQKCLSEWFDTTLRNFLVSHPNYNPMAMPVLPHMAYLLNHPGAINNPAVAQFFPAQPEYTCPECRAPVKTRPVENFAMKTFVRMSVTARQGRAPPSPARPRGSPWEGFFPHPRT